MEAEIVTFDPTKFEHLEKLVSQLEPGDVLRVFFARPHSFMLEYPKLTPDNLEESCNQLIVANEHLPDDYANPYAQSNSLDRQRIMFTADPQASTPVGVFYGFICDYGFGCEFIDRIENKAYRTKSTIWLELGMATRFSKEQLRTAAPSVTIDVHCLGAYQKIASKVWQPLPDEIQNMLSSRVRNKSDSFGDHFGDMHREQLFSSASKRGYTSLMRTSIDRPSLRPVDQPPDK